MKTLESTFARHPIHMAQLLILSKSTKQVSRGIGERGEEEMGQKGWRDRREGGGKRVGRERRKWTEERREGWEGNEK